jgi:hypothetical protein
MLLRLAHRLPLKLRRESPSFHPTPPISSSHLSKVSGIAGESQELEAENAKLKKLLAEAHLDVEALKVAFGVKR